MAKVRLMGNRLGVQTVKYKTGSSGGGFGANPKSVAGGSCLTWTAADEVGLAGAGDRICGFLEDDSVDTTSGKCNLLGPGAWEIADILTEGTIPVDSSIVGNSDTDRGKAKAAGASDSPKAAWVVKSSSAGKANVVPRQ